MKTSPRDFQQQLHRTAVIPTALLLPFLGKAKLNGLRRTLISLCLFLSEKWGPNLFSVYFFLSAYLISTLDPNFFDHINILKISVSVTW